MTIPDSSIEDEVHLREMAAQIVENMVSSNVAEKVFCTDERVEKEYWVLTTPKAFEKEFIAVAVLGHPEQVGVWSYTLLSQGRVDQSSMEPYFREFSKCGFGLVAINPNFFAPDIEGKSFHYQLGKATGLVPKDGKLGLIGFSMGGRIVVEFLEQHPELLDRIKGLVLIDPTLPNRLRVGNIHSLLNKDTLLVASEDENSPGKIASALLNIPAVSFPGIHGEMPNKALPDIIRFYQQRTH